MHKKLLLIIVPLISILIIFNNLTAEAISIIPLKKPTLSSDKFKKKQTKNNS